jgi:hypothetical protein
MVLPSMSICGRVFWSLQAVSKLSVMLSNSPLAKTLAIKNPSKRGKALQIKQSAANEKQIKVKEHFTGVAVALGLTFGS